MIRCFTGLPGAGKSYAATEDGINELRSGFRTVFHNMEMDHGEIAMYLRDKGYEPDLSVRIHKIPDDHVREFWVYATAHAPNPTPTGRLFIIDEAHVYFDSRAWAEVGKQMSVYLTQHRHLNDEILFVTQHPEMLDKRIRLLIAETTQFRNLRTERWLQWFRPPSWMVWSQFYGLPKFGQKPQAVGRKRLDMAIARCYKTSVGHGGLGRSGAPEGDRKTSRLNWKWLVVPAAALLYLANAGPELLIKWGIGGSIKGLQSVAAPAPPPKETVSYPVVNPVTLKVDPGQPRMPGSGAASAATQEPQAPLRVRGFVADRSGMRIVLNDGRVLTEEDRPYRKAGRIHWSTGESAIFNR